MKVKNILSSDGDVIAIVVKKQDVESLNFITPESYPLQLGISLYKGGSKIKPHVHNRIRRLVDLSQEMVYVEKGRARVFFYDEKGNAIQDEVLKSGDVVFFASGGHGFDILADTTIIEVKQGPFHGTQKEKTFLKKVMNE